MSYVALATDSFDAVARFYGEDLGFAVAGEWDRANGRARRFDLHGLRLEILDNARRARGSGSPRHRRRPFPGAQRSFKSATRTAYQ
jgi:hypothetical protein